MACYSPRNMQVCLRDESVSISVHAATMMWSLKIKLAVLPSHSTLTQWSPVLVLTLPCKQLAEQPPRYLFWSYWYELIQQSWVWCPCLLPLRQTPYHWGKHLTTEANTLPLIATGGRHLTTDSQPLKQTPYHWGRCLTTEADTLPLRQTPYHWSPLEADTLPLIASHWSRHLTTEADALSLRPYH